jgi:hypothetical protein
MKGKNISKNTYVAPQRDEEGNIIEAEEPRVNIPYVKHYNEEGDLINPIANGKSFINVLPNRKTRRFLSRAHKSKNNKKGVRLVVTKIGPMEFFKTKLVKQRIGDKLITHTTWQ